MRVCWCVLAGTDACKHCSNGSTGIDYYHSEYIVYDNYPTKEQLDSITRKEDEWEIPSFMNKGDEYDRKS